MNCVRIEKRFRAGSVEIVQDLSLAFFRIYHTLIDRVELRCRQTCKYVLVCFTV